MFGDSSCLDEAPYRKLPTCFWLLDRLLKFTEEGTTSFSPLMNFFEGQIDDRLSVGKPLQEAFKSEKVSYPVRLEGNDLHKYSKVFGHSITCKRMEYKTANQSHVEEIQLNWEVLCCFE